MGNVDRSKPYIAMERGKTGVLAQQLVMSNGSRADVVIDRTEANAAALDYFHEKLKDGLNV